MIWDLIGEIRARVILSLKVDGFDIGFADSSPDDGSPGHTHVHVVPRTPGGAVRLPSGIEWVDLGIT